MQMPQIIYGTAWKKERTEALVVQALRDGFRGIDTACQPKHYHEPGVGAALAVLEREGLRREQVYVQTKFTAVAGHDPQRIPYDSAASLPEQVAQSFAVSLRNLGTTYVDGFILHSPMSSDEQTLEAWRAMEAIMDSGSARRLGISNCYQLDVLERLYNASRIKPSIVQNRFYADTGYDRELRRFCERKGLEYQSFWTLTANPQLLSSEPVRRLCAKYQRTPAQVLFRYLTQVEVKPLTGTTSAQHVREDLAIFEFELTPSELEAVTALL